jgi:endogenous inhibitor of DNA gyrase (YacG/DUF329 family)
MASDPNPRVTARCPICRRASQAESRPFCSPRCAQVDLGRWLTGGYAIPAGPETAQDNDEEDA